MSGMDHGAINLDDDVQVALVTGTPPADPPVLYDASDITWTNVVVDAVPLDDSGWLGPRDVDDLLADIDGLLEEWELGGDAMRWSPEPDGPPEDLRPLAGLLEWDLEST